MQTATLRHLRYFVTVVDAGSISRAAATIHVAQPALSRQMFELEDVMGIDLLHRTARGVRPTAMGECLYREAQRILRQVDELPARIRGASGVIEGVVTIGMSSTLASYLAGQLMEACAAAFPQLKLRIVTNDSLQLKARVDANQIDLAIVFEDQPAPEYSSRALFRQRLYFVSRTPLSAGFGQIITLQKTAELPTVMPTLPNVLRILLDRVYQEAGLVPNVVGEADVFASLMGAVASGMGDAVLPIGDLAMSPGYSNLIVRQIAPPMYLSAALIRAQDVPLSHVVGLVGRLTEDFIHRLVQAGQIPGAEWIGAEAAQLEDQ
ncbi:MAG TPA: LysR substrate-binding domain-containing protein [Stenotrophomonas sp.]|nr:LysR substrate-binding domain-containing protein [Stenotrophomonas sp.]